MSFLHINPSILNKIWYLPLSFYLENKPEQNCFYFSYSVVSRPEWVKSLRLSDIYSSANVAITVSDNGLVPHSFINFGFPHVATGRTLQFHSISYPNFCWFINNNISQVTAFRSCWFLYENLMVVYGKSIYAFSPKFTNYHISHGL